jgi:hypothetical protein
MFEKSLAILVATVYTVLPSENMSSFMYSIYTAHQSYSSRRRKRGFLEDLFDFDSFDGKSYCNSKNFGSIDGYERHIVTSAHKLTRLSWTCSRLENQDMYWEREIKSGF